MDAPYYNGEPGAMRYERRASDSHSHPCSNFGCTNAVPCCGSWSRNYDGYPEVVCDIWHEQLDMRAECDECESARCDECGSVVRLEDHDLSCEVGKVEAMDRR